MKKRGFLLAGAFVAVSIVAFLAGRASKGKGLLAALLLKETLQEKDCFHAEPKPPVYDAPKTASISEQPSPAAEDDKNTVVPQIVQRQAVQVLDRITETDPAEDRQKESPLSPGYVEGIPAQSEQEGQAQLKKTALMPPAPYILSTNTRKFHRPTCREVKKIRPQHYATAYTRKEAMGMNCSPCQRCKP